MFKIIRMAPRLYSTKQMEGENWWANSESGHGGSNYWAGVYTTQPYWGGVDDYLVSPRLDVEEGESLLILGQGEIR